MRYDHIDNRHMRIVSMSYLELHFSAKNTKH